MALGIRLWVLIITCHGRIFLGVGRKGRGEGGRGREGKGSKARGGK